MAKGRKVEKPIVAFHMPLSDMRLGYRDGRHIKLCKKIVHKDLDIEVCRSGLHASENMYRCLVHARSDIITMVEITGRYIRASDKSKLVATERTAIKIIPEDSARELMVKFAIEIVAEAVKEHMPDGMQKVAMIKSLGRLSLAGDNLNAELLGGKYRAISSEKDRVTMYLCRAYNELIRLRLDCDVRHMLEYIIQCISLAISHEENKSRDFSVSIDIDSDLNMYIKGAYDIKLEEYGKRLNKKVEEW